MPVDINQARALCSAPEFELYRASRPELIKTHTPGRLQSKIRRARNLRDKYRDLYQRQRLATRSRTGTKKGKAPDRNARTEQKAKLFGEVLERLLKQEARLAASAAKADAKTKAPGPANSAKKPTAPHKPAATTAAKAKPKARPGTAPGARKAKPRRRTGDAAEASGKGPATGYLSQAAARANRRQQLQKTRSKAVMGHTRAAGKRGQARRDSRR